MISRMSVSNVNSLLKSLILNGQFKTTSLKQCQRSLNLHEYQSKKLLQDNGVDVQRFKLAQSSDEASDVGKELLNTFAKELVIKSQVLAGGRGKGYFMNSKLKGGIQLTQDYLAVKSLASKMIGDKLVTKQTGNDGVVVNKLMIAEALDIVKETYVAILLDRSVGGPVVVASPCGGMDIEEVAENQPDQIIKEVIDLDQGLTRAQADKIASKLNLSNKDIEKRAAEQIIKLYDLFNNYDCTMIEINPLGETPDGRVVCFDAKIVFDDSASFRHRNLFDEEDTTELDQKEVRASKLGLNYISLGPKGNIGCMVNGAGLAMATMDVIKLHGGEPANFLDLGGTVGEEQVSKALQLLYEDSNVKSVLVNIFGGIVNCETIANGIIKACKTFNLTRPLIVRLQGTNVEAARKALANSKLPIINASDLADAASKAVESNLDNVLI